MSNPSHSDIALRAYQMWEREGRPHGRDKEHWATAEREILGAATAQQDQPIGEIRAAQTANAGRAGAASPGESAAPSPVAAKPAQAAAKDGAKPQAPAGQSAAKQAPSRGSQSRAGQPSGVQASQSASGKTEPPGGPKPGPADSRKRPGKQPA